MTLDLSEYQSRIEAIPWYHEYDFPNGLKARSKSPYVGYHHRVWRFIEQQLNSIDFRDKSVLDIGCWDGYWSFYAERRGASHVLATDDQTQNWAGSAGFLLARELLGSAVDTKLDVSVYQLDSLGGHFDIILCLGVYYHLVDPFYAFNQIRHRCHKDTIVVLEGAVTTGIRPHTALICLSDTLAGEFVPTRECLDEMLTAAYLRPVSQTFMRPVSLLWEWGSLMRYYAKAIVGKRYHTPPGTNRAFTVCKPFEGMNKMQMYKPPFGLCAYDDRFR